MVAGHTSGFQQRTIEKNYKTLFVNCDNRSLNFVGVIVAKQEVIVVTCFGIIENIYLFLMFNVTMGIIKKNCNKNCQT